ncbi:unnamed protein product [Calypogeia fissa]
MDSDDDIDVLVAHHVNIIYVVAKDDEATEKILNAQHGGSRPGRAPNLFQVHIGGHERIWDDYFCENPVYPSHIFRRRFRMRKSVFFKIHEKLVEHVPYFVHKPDAVGSPGLSSIQKVTAALRMFCYGIVADGVDEYVRISESTAIAAFKQFANGVVELFGDEYLHHPTKEDVVRHMEINTRRGWSGMFGSLDCSHWVWRNCPIALQGQFHDKDGNPKHTNFACKQEGARKDVERCFGVLQALFAITTNPSRLWSLSTMETIWKAAIIMHNMIIEDEEDEDDLNHDYLFENQPQFNQLKKDLVEHLWAVHGNEEQ